MTEMHAPQQAVKCPKVSILQWIQVKPPIKYVQANNIKRLPHEPQAAAVAARVHLRSTKNAHAVLAVLRSFGFKPASIARLVTTRPSVLSSTNIGAKLDFYRRELGLSDTEICRVVLSSPHRPLEASLEGRLRPNHRLLRDLLGTDKNVITAVIQSMRLITHWYNMSF
ncbi:hypothetical protein EJB05_49623, partial [Eragrostis curvula]